MRTNEGYIEVLNQVQELLENLEAEHSKEDFHDGVKDALEQTWIQSSVRLES